MKIAIFSVSQKGKKLAENLEKKLNKDSTIIKIDTYYKNVKKNITNAFNEYDAIIGIMATGILVRSISPLIVSKTKDPAVISIDESGNFVISLLSGHIGGANKLTEKIANIINGTPVITTATDVNNKLAIDTLSNKFYWKIENPENIVIFNKALLNDEKIDLILNNKHAKYIKKFLDDKLEFNLVISNDNWINAKFDNYLLDIIPSKLVVGVGARKGISEKKVLNAIKSTMDTLDLDIDRIDSLATIDVKKNELGIIKTADNLNVPLNIVKSNIVKDFDNKYCSKSSFVEDKIGVSGVCEPCALITAGEGSELIYKKTAFDGVTVAVAVSK